MSNALDLHLTEPGLDNHRTALWMVGEVNDLVRPDFVQFIGDNVQIACLIRRLIIQSRRDQSISNG